MTKVITCTCDLCNKQVSGEVFGWGVTSVSEELVHVCPECVEDFRTRLSDASLDKLETPLVENERLRKGVAHILVDVCKDFFETKYDTKLY
ncbi:MAG: hypothetical protein KAJ19_06790 [Gammaproteobacteria bacterium]|nr:hypothetical protein [Gammaproteobacteria bacterium]